MEILNVDFDNVLGKIKPMNAVNNGPRQFGATLSRNITKEFNEMSIPCVRLHDTEAPYGTNQYVDIHCIFPNFDADVDDPASYNFYQTDLLLKYIKEAGCDIYYRFGESIDHYNKKLYIHPPKDYLKWAKICEHIILHYNYGWANGFNLGVKYWEIWNEPDNFRMWSGTKEQFFELYRVTACYLKEKFPNELIGGYASSGFYMLNRENACDWFKTLVPYQHDFFKYITNENTKAPMDFFAWHCYADYPEEVALHEKYARDLLHQYGFDNCLSILDEYNNTPSLDYNPAKDSKYASELASTLIIAQKSTLDMLMYYDMRLTTYMNGCLLFDHMRGITKLCGYYVYTFFGKLYKEGNYCYSDDIKNKLYVLSAKNDNEKSIMISALDFNGKIQLNINGVTNKKAVLKTLAVNEPDKEKKVSIKNGKLTLNVKKEYVYLIDII